MPLPGFIQGFADKAQSAVSASPLAAHLPTRHSRASSPDNASQPPANEAAATGGHRSHALGNIQHQLRALGQQYGSTSPVQKIITSEKGVAIDFDSVSHDAKLQSKELYTWGQTESDDLKDVTDRLAYLNFVQGSLASSLSVKLDSARAPIKALRDAEISLTPRRNIRSGMQMQISRIEHDQQVGMEKKVSELKDQLKKAQLDDDAQEKEVELLKRKAIRESEQKKWDALREYGEKLILLSQAATPIIGALPTLPPSASQPYAGHQATGAARASLQRALDNYKTGHINLPPQSPASELSRSDTVSFGESHASELSSINTAPGAHGGRPETPPAIGHQPPSHPPSSYDSSIDHIQTTSPPTHSTSSPLDPSVLNKQPTPLPAASSSTTVPIPVAIPDPTKPSPSPPSITPTVAETGVPLSAGASGPGPASGSLHDIRGADVTAGPKSGGLPGNTSLKPEYGSAAAVSSQTKYESAEEEKRRLQREDRERVLAAAPAPTQPPAATAQPSTSHGYETAEEEKKRIERERREQILGQSGSEDPVGPGPSGKDEDLPPYQDY